MKPLATAMLGHKLVTKQTGPEGQQVSRVLINASLDIEKEYYFAVMMDRASGGPLIIVSKEGGMDIEEVAEKHPEAIIRVRRCCVASVRVACPLRRASRARVCEPRACVSLVVLTVAFDVGVALTVVWWWYRVVP